MSAANAAVAWLGRAGAEKRSASVGGKLIDAASIRCPPMGQRLSISLGLGAEGFSHSDSPGRPIRSAKPEAGAVQAATRVS